MKLLIAKVNETLFDGDAYSVRVPGSAGEMTILAAHMPLVTPLKAGTIYVRETRDALEKEFEVTSGVLEVNPDSVAVLV